jgi:hypothetical protein
MDALDNFLFQSTQLAFFFFPEITPVTPSSIG